MTDPFDVLAAEVAPVDPDPRFARELRARVERALALPRGVAVSALPEVEPEVAPSVGGAIAYLAVDGARDAIDWYVDVLGARVVGDPIVMPDERIGHAELAIGPGVIYLADAHPEIGVVAPTPGQATVSLMLEVDDADARLARAVAEGATRDREVYDAYGHRNAWLTDPFGHRWCLQGPVPTAFVRSGDLGYFMWQTPEVEAAAAFYAAVLGWNVRAGSVPDSRRIASAPIDLGLFAGTRSTGYPAFAVTSVDDAVLAVRAAGGTAGEPDDAPHGRTAECVDDQGLAFVVYEAGPADARPVFDRPGNLGYLVFETPDADRAAAFYGSVLGWPRKPEDQWTADDPVPLHGLPGGREPCVVPMWLVDDVAAAVERVRAAGGTATDPEQRPYGPLSTCTDDQGGRFYLGAAT